MKKLINPIEGYNTLAKIPGAKVGYTAILHNR
jgi:hypothetical protein